MATVSELFPANAVAITLTLNSLASSGTVGRASTAVDNSANLDLDAHVMIALSQNAAAVANDKVYYVFAYGSYDGVTYPEGITGTDASYTLLGAASALLTALRPIGIIPGIASNTNTWGPFSVAKAFDGILPVKWGLVFLNFEGQTLAASANSAAYTRIKGTVA